MMSAGGNSQKTTSLHIKRKKDSYASGDANGSRGPKSFLFTFYYCCLSEWKQIGISGESMNVFFDHQRKVKDDFSMISMTLMTLRPL